MNRSLLAVLAILAASAANAKIVGVVKDRTGATIALHDDRGQVCVGDARRAEHVTAAGVVTNGCWALANAEQVFVVFFDAEVATLPISAIKPPKTL